MKLAADPIAGPALRAAGWKPSRSEDVTRLATWFRDEGYAPDERVLEFLRSVGNLTVVPADHPGAQFGSGKVVFDPALASTGEQIRIADRERQVGDTLWPVGEWSDTYILLWSRSGKLYAESSEYGVLLLGASLADGLKTIITRVGHIEVAVPMRDVGRE
jgi:hypothetical protein